MTHSASEIADQMRALADDRVKSQQMVASLFAETIELHHVPAMPTDGPIAGALLAELSRREIEAAGRAMPDMISKTEVEAEGEGVRVRGHTHGTLADGTAVDVRSNTLFTVSDGAITALHAELDQESLAAWGAVLVAGGFTLPEDFLAAH